MSQTIAVTVLAGGDSSRIGGAKPLRELAGHRLIDRALDLARNYSGTIAVSVRDNGQIERVDADVIDDDPVEGPLGGLIAGMLFARKMGAPLLLLIPADTPFLPPDLAERLLQAIGPYACAVASSGGRIHPVCTLWRVEALEGIASYLATGRRSLHGLMEWVGAATVEWEGGEADPFFNINTTEDLVEAERRLRAVR